MNEHIIERLSRMQDFQIEERTDYWNVRTLHKSGCWFKIVLPKNCFEWFATVPSKDLYEFSGVIRQDSMTGTLEKKQIDDSRKTDVREEKVVLKDESPAGQSYWSNKTYEQWVEFYKRIPKSPNQNR